MESGITITAPHAICTTVAKMGQQWMLLHPSIESGVHDFLIVRTESGERLILCDLERHTDPDGWSIEATPVKRSSAPMWPRVEQEE